MCQNILLKSLKYIQINLKYIHFPLSLTFQLSFVCKSTKLYFSCYNDVDTDGYACSHILRLCLQMWILMQMRMQTGLFPILIYSWSDLSVSNSVRKIKRSATSYQIPGCKTLILFYIVCETSFDDCV